MRYSAGLYSHVHIGHLVRTVDSLGAERVFRVKALVEDGNPFGKTFDVRDASGNQHLLMEMHRSGQDSYYIRLDGLVDSSGFAAPAQDVFVLPV